MRRFGLLLALTVGVLGWWGQCFAQGFNPHNSCSGLVTVTAGAITVQAPCAASYTTCQCFPNPGIGATPVAGALCACAPTSTATVISSATVTVPAFAIVIAGTPSPSPAIIWQGGPQ